MKESTKKSSLPRVENGKEPTILEKLQHKNWQKIQLPSHRYHLRSRHSGTNFKAVAARNLHAQHLFSHPTCYHIYDPSGNRLTIRKLLQGDDCDIWLKALSMEFGRLAQGNKYGVSSTDTFDFIHSIDIPSNEKVTYAQFVCDERPLKPEKYRIRLVVGGDKLDCDIDSGAPSTNFLEFKLLVNSIISEASKGARFMSIDLKDFLLSSL